MGRVPGMVDACDRNSHPAPHAKHKQVLRIVRGPELVRKTMSLLPGLKGPANIAGTRVAVDHRISPRLRVCEEQDFRLAIAVEVADPTHVTGQGRQALVIRQCIAELLRPQLSAANVHHHEHVSHHPPTSRDTTGKNIQRCGGDERQQDRPGKNPRPRERTAASRRSGRRESLRVSRRLQPRIQFLHRRHHAAAAARQPPHRQTPFRLPLLRRTHIHAQVGSDRLPRTQQATGSPGGLVSHEGAPSARHYHNRPGRDIGATERAAGLRTPCRTECGANRKM